MPSPHDEMWERMDLDLEAHAGLLEVLGKGGKNPAGQSVSLDRLFRNEQPHHKEASFPQRF